MSTVTLDQLHALVLKVHEWGLAQGWGDEGPASEPVLAQLVRLPGGLYTVPVDVPGSAWGEYGPPAVIDSIAVASDITDSFVGFVFTMEAWAVVPDEDDPRSTMALARKRKLYTRPDRRSCRVTVACTVDDLWSMVMTVEGEEDTPEILTSATAEDNPDHHVTWRSSGVSVALTALVGRAVGRRDAQAMT